MRHERALWAVYFTGASIHPQDNAPMLIFGSWHDAMRGGPRYNGEPPRAVLFRTRAAARAWCAEQHAEYKGRRDCCAQWRFRPVRVRETVEPV